MDDILEKLNLATLKQRFKDERVDVDGVLSATDNELTRLGVTTIGDRIRLRDECKNVKKAEESVPMNAQASYSRSSLQERLGLFSTKGRSKGGASSKNRKRPGSFTINAMCLADSFSTKVPTVVEKQILIKAGLGLKKIKLELEDDEETVISKLTSDAKGDGGKPLGFPALKKCGGFEMMQCLPNCRDLSRMDCSWNATDIKTHLGGGQGKIYLVPIQKSISTKPKPEDCSSSQSALTEECKSCKKKIPIYDLRKHMWECLGDIDLSSDDDDLLQSAFDDQSPNAPQISQAASASSSTSTLSGSNCGLAAIQDSSASTSSTASFITASTVASSSTSSSNLTATQNTSTSSTATTSSSPTTASSSSINSTATTSTVTSSSNSPTGASSSPVAIDLTDERSDEMDSVDKVVGKVVKYIKDKEVQNPVEVLRCLQKFMVTGRDLEVEHITESLDGQTNYILVDRNNILETAIDEIKTLTDLRKTLEVDFYNEAAQDSGGPRKEFLRLVLQEIKTKYFDNGLRELLKEDYEAVGIILGLSILQNGKLPTFLGEDIINKVFSDESSEPCITELQQGLKKIGIYQIGLQVPIFLHLLRPGPSQPLTVKILTHLLKPSFSCEGSNKRTLENTVYSMFIKYIREVASGRRHGVQMEDILSFVTGACEEPVLGFVLQPKLEFVEYTNSFLPTSSTCTNSLSLPHPTDSMKLPPQEKLFSLYDYAFCNAFFGVI